MNEHVVPDMSGAPEYEQKELRSNEVHVSAILRMARAELLLIFLFFSFLHCFYFYSWYTRGQENFPFFLPGVLAQLGARNIRIVEATGSNPVYSISNLS